ncbi:kinase-like domain-containing protein [Mycena rebaudengoi]|nr:kinase-like domain-containing protein [Mycena rebaudengoi]
MASRLPSGHSQVVPDLTESLGEFPLLTSQITIGSFPTAQGGFSDVYRGQYTRPSHAHRAHHNTCFTTEIAVKVLRVTEECNLDRALKHLKKEATVWMQLCDTVHVAKFYGVAVVGGRPALILEWCSQGTARDYLEGKSLDERLRVILGLTTGLAYVHSRNVVHGDLKGNNVLISNNGYVVLSDFGLSRTLERHTGYTTSNSSAGSVNWSSPELIRPWFQTEETHVKTLASDVWAFACTVYELLTDTTPYASLPSQTVFKIAETINQHITPLEALPAQPVQIPERIRTILERCWAPQPAERPSMAEVVEMLSA